jgi:hypothetical protein
MAAALLAIHAGLLAWGASCHSPTIDEVGHLAAGLSHWQRGRFDLYRVNPPLVRMVAVLPVLACQPAIDWRRCPEDYHQRHEFATFSVLAGWISWRWGSELFGPAAGLTTLTLWCFCPLVLGNAQMITSDTGAAALGVTAHYAFWRWLKRSDWAGALLVGLCLGLAELTKSTWIILFPLWPILWLAWRWPQRSALDRRAWLAQSGQLATALLLALYLINAVYAFDGTFQPLDSYSFASRALAGPGEGERPGATGNRFAGTHLGQVPVPLPRPYVYGIDLQKREFEEGFRSYLAGEWKRGGWGATTCTAWRSRCR